MAYPGLPLGTGLCAASLILKIIEGTKPAPVCAASRARTRSCSGTRPPLRPKIRAFNVPGQPPGCCFTKYSVRVYSHADCSLTE
jgi:hypothetical protein